MIKASAYTAWGLFFTAAEQAEIAGPLGEALLGVPWGPDLCKHAAGNAIRPGMAMFASNGLRLPRFISWILPFRWDHICLLLPGSSCGFHKCLVPSCLSALASATSRRSLCTLVHLVYPLFTVDATVFMPDLLLIAVQRENLHSVSAWETICSKYCSVKLKISASQWCFFLS